MSFDAQSLQSIKKEAERLGVEWQSLAAVAEVESAGKPLWEGLCPIRIEGHFFYKRLTGTKRTKAVAQGFASPAAGKIKNPAKMTDRYAMLDKMKQIDAIAAIESCSWGLGQVMGAHWKILGFDSAQSLSTEAQSSVAGQIRLMGRFIKNKKLVSLLKKRDWAKFASLYNGPSYKKNRYDEKMAKAYQGFIKSSQQNTQNVSEKDQLIERGQRGEVVSQLQSELAKLGYYKGAIDGIFGGGTELSVMDFQRDAQIQVDGRAGSQTLQAISAWSTKKTIEAQKIGRARVVYVNQHSIRNRPCTAFLEESLALAVFAVYGANHEAQIYSGGQPMKGTVGQRTGSIRHDDYGKGGRALDAYILNPEGKKLEREDLGKLGQYWLAMGHGGCGLEMAVGGIHLDEWKSPPAGAGMCWTYPYSDGKPWGKIVKRMLADGLKGIKPK